MFVQVSDLRNEQYCSVRCSHSWVHLSVQKCRVAAGDADTAFKPHQTPTLLCKNSKFRFTCSRRSYLTTASFTRTANANCVAEFLRF